MTNDKLTHACKSNPCPHCGKTDWCYSLDELTVCKRGAEPAAGWERTTKTDREGTPYYAPVQQKCVRPKAKKDYFYPARDGSPLVKVTRIDDGTGKKSFPQSHWNNGQWDWGNPDHIKCQIPIYRYAEIQQAIAAGKQIFVVEGEGVADTLWEMGLAATTFIGGSGKYNAYGAGYKEDLAGAKIVLCPDRDEPGIKHMEEIAQDFPDAQWLYAPPNPFFWDNLPKSQGLDIGDWIGDGATVADILQQIGAKKVKQPGQAQQTSVKGNGCGEVIYSEDERLRLALLDLSQEKNKIAYIRKRAQICTHYRISKAEVEELLRETERNTSASALKRSSLDNLLDMEIQELTWLIPELLPAGEMVILGGSPKSGKTLMAIDAAFAIATGEDDFLGIRPKQGKVLLISNDENARSTRSKLLKRGFRSGDGKNLEVIFNWTIAQMYELEQVLDEFRPNLVIIDSLKSITAHNAEISENSAEFANNIYTLKNLLNQYNAASILIHHTSKNKDAMGVAKLRGSSAIAGAVWGTWQLEHIPKPDPNNNKALIIDPSDPNRTMSVFARDVEGQLLALEFDPENNSYNRTDKEVLQEQNTMADRIMSVLKLNPHGLSGRDIIECLGMSREEGGRGIYTTLTRMESKLLVSTIKSPSDRRVTLYISRNSQHLEKNSQQKGDSLSPPPRVQNVDYSSESLIQHGLQNSQQKNQISQQHTENSQQLPNTLCTDDYSKPLPDMDSSELVNIVNTGGGERVSPDMLTNSTECQKEQTATTVELIGKTVAIAAGGNLDGKIGQVVGFDGDQCKVLVSSSSKTITTWFAPKYLVVQQQEAP